jgi:cbb3-type cytochrome oxidase subunit 3
MNYKLKIFGFTIFLLGVIIFSLPTSVFADRYGVSDTAGATSGLLPTSIGGASTIPEFIGVVVRVVLSFLAIVFFLLIFYAGLIWMTARGNPENISKAKGMMEAAVIGLVIVVSAYAITRFIFQGLATGNTNTRTTVESADCAKITKEEDCVKGGCAWNYEKDVCEKKPNF